jgi:hypothetical protein
MKTVRIGELVKVDNQQRKNGANAEYYHVIVKGNRGPFKLLFTKSELDAANARIAELEASAAQESLLVQQEKQLLAIVGTLWVLALFYFIKQII